MTMPYAANTIPQGLFWTARTGRAWNNRRISLIEHEEEEFLKAD